MKINARSAKVAITYFRSKPLRILFAILWAVFVYQIISAGFSSDPFSRYDSSGSSAHLYPMDLTKTLISVMVLHLILLLAIDIFMHSGWKFLIMLVITIPFLFYFILFILFIVHASPPIAWMVFWQLSSSLIFLVLCIWQVFSFLRSKF